MIDKQLAARSFIITQQQNIWEHADMLSITSSNEPPKQTTIITLLNAPFFPKTSIYFLIASLISTAAKKKVEGARTLS